MTCTMESIEAMAEAGWSQQQIEQLEKEVELAKAIASKQAADNGYNVRQQDTMVRQAEARARQIAHDRWHRELGDLMGSISNAAAEKVPAGHVSDRSESKTAEQVARLTAIKSLLGEG